MGSEIEVTGYENSLQTVKNTGLEASGYQGILNALRNFNINVDVTSSPSPSPKIEEDNNYGVTIAIFVITVLLGGGFMILKK